MQKRERELTEKMQQQKIIKNFLKKHKKLTKLD